MSYVTVHGDDHCRFSPLELLLPPNQPLRERNQRVVDRIAYPTLFYCPTLFYYPTLFFISGTQPTMVNYGLRSNSKLEMEMA
jgi:hypothetical protein